MFWMGFRRKLPKGGGPEAMARLASREQDADPGAGGAGPGSGYAVSGDQLHRRLALAVCGGLRLRAGHRRDQRRGVRDSRP